jgi:hypothetical protein
MWAFAFGRLHGRADDLDFSLPSRASKARGNFASRSWIRNRPAGRARQAPSAGCAPAAASTRCPACWCRRGTRPGAWRCASSDVGCVRRAKHTCPVQMQDLRRLATQPFSDVRGSKTDAHRQLIERAVALLLIVVFADLAGWLATWRIRGVGLGVWDAWVWASSQLLVGGSSIPFERKPWGARLVEIGLQSVAVFVVAALAGCLGAFFHRRGLERSPL